MFTYVGQVFSRENMGFTVWRQHVMNNMSSDIIILVVMIFSKLDIYVHGTMHLIYISRHYLNKNSVKPVGHSV